MEEHKHHRGGPDECFGCRIKGIRFGAAVMVNTQVQESRDLERRLERDLPAYRQLRREGIQPKSTVGAYEAMMGAQTKNQIEGNPEGWENRHEIIADAIPRVAS
jgi:hypothetical protein